MEKTITHDCLCTLTDAKGNEFMRSELFKDDKIIHDESTGEFRIVNANGVQRYLIALKSSDRFTLEGDHEASRPESRSRKRHDDEVSG